MKKLFKKISSLLLALAVAMSFALPAFAEDTSVTYKGELVFGPGESSYTATDLFDNFKGVMPGDALTQKITVKNTYKGCDYVKLYLRAVPHDEQNPLSSEVEAAGETVESVNDFLSQLSMTVYNGSTAIYQAPLNELDGLAENVLLGSFTPGETAELTVQLVVPLELGNQYANRVGEVDWIFTAEEFNFPVVNPDPAQVTLSAGKTVNGKAPEGSDFSFVLRDDNGRTVQTVHNRGGSVVFDTLTFTRAGTYRYTISEQAGSAEGMTYDGSVYTAVITVKRAKGDYTATVEWQKDGTSCGSPVFENLLEESSSDLEEIPEESVPLSPPEGSGGSESSQPGSNAPQTGDNALIWPYILLLAVGLVGMLAAPLIKRRNKRQK